MGISIILRLDYWKRNVSTAVSTTVTNVAVSSRLLCRHTCAINLHLCASQCMYTGKCVHVLRQPGGLGNPSYTNLSVSSEQRQTIAELMPSRTAGDWRRSVWQVCLSVWLSHTHPHIHTRTLTHKWTRCVLAEFLRRPSLCALLSISMGCQYQWHTIMTNALPIIHAQIHRQTRIETYKSYALRPRMIVCWKLYYIFPIWTVLDRLAPCYVPTHKHTL